MPRPKRWTESAAHDGLSEFTFSHWRYFGEFIHQKFLDFRHYVFRGHASERWRLESTLDRALKSLPKDARERARLAHFDNFKMAARGRRGPNPRQGMDEDEWWALGQHHGLATPLLDWTQSPFVALYFAFNEVDASGADFRAVWALSEPSIQRVAKGAYAELRLVKPLSDENARLVSQRGLFVRCPAGVSIDDAYKSALKGKVNRSPLLKFRLPNKDRTDCLRFLNRMNINHLTLFPDLMGASIHCNTDLVIKRY